MSSHSYLALQTSVKREETSSTSTDLTHPIAPTGILSRPCIRVTGLLCQILPRSLPSPTGRRDVPRLACLAQLGPIQGALWRPPCLLCLLGSPYFTRTLSFLTTGSSLKALNGCFPCITITDKNSSLKY